ncbi:MAG: HAD family phosphatase [Sedimentisphaerales bacterium]|nr:HAD family phosphatase [Sedimentisphaerales bacterium]
MLKAIIFDFDGVLVDSEQFHLQAFNSVFAKFNFQLSTQEYYERFLGLSDKELLLVVAKERKLSLSTQQFEQLLQEKAIAFKKLASTQATVYPGVPQFLKMLADNKIPLAICSGALLPEIELILKGAGLRNFFDIIVSAEQVKYGKPDPEGFLLALKLLNKKTNQKIEPQDCIVIEDSHWGLEAAKTAGMHPVAVTNTYSADQLKPADKIVANLGELTFADLQTLCC